jgi:hypothetical protein
MLAAILWGQVIGSVLMPPARFDHVYPGHITVVWMDYAEIIRRCRSTTMQTRACMIYRGNGQCVILINAAYRGTWLQPLILRHERAHCNGWSARHED